MGGGGKGGGVHGSTLNAGDMVAMRAVRQLAALKAARETGRRHSAAAGGNWHFTAAPMHFARKAARDTRKAHDDSIGRQRMWADAQARSQRGRMLRRFGRLDEERGGHRARARARGAAPAAAAPVGRWHYFDEDGDDNGDDRGASDGAGAGDGEEDAGGSVFITSSSSSKATAAREAREAREAKELRRRYAESDAIGQLRALAARVIQAHWRAHHTAGARWLRVLAGQDVACTRERAEAAAAAEKARVDAARRQAKLAAEAEAARIVRVAAGTEAEPVAAAASPPKPFAVSRFACRGGWDSPLRTPGKKERFTPPTATGAATSTTRGRRGTLAKSGGKAGKAGKAGSSYQAARPLRMWPGTTAVEHVQLSALKGEIASGRGYGGERHIGSALRGGAAQSARRVSRQLVLVEERDGGYAGLDRYDTPEKRSEAVLRASARPAFAPGSALSLRRAPRSPQRTPYFNDPLNLVEQEYGAAGRRGDSPSKGEDGGEHVEAAAPRELTFV